MACAPTGRQCGAPAERPRVAADRARAAVSSLRVFHLRQDQGQVSTAAWAAEGSADDGQGATPAGCTPGEVEVPHVVSLSGAHIELLCPINTADWRIGVLVDGGDHCGHDDQKGVTVPWCCA